MKRGYVAWLMGYAQEAADRIRELPDGDGGYRSALKDATALAIRLRDAAPGPHLIDTFNQIAERINELPDDPADEMACQRRDGQYPTTSRRYVHG